MALLLAGLCVASAAGAQSGTTNPTTAPVQVPGSGSLSVSSQPMAPRITQAIDETKLVALRGNTHPLARPEYDRGPAPDSLMLHRMLLVLQRSPQQEAALESLLEQQQDKSSPNFHHWLTPQQFGQQFGPADADIATITAWLASHGFEVNRIANGRTVIEFSGTAGQLRQAFHTEIHEYIAPPANAPGSPASAAATSTGEAHWANASDPQIPAALAPVVAGFASLNNFGREPMNRYVGAFRRDRTTGRVSPLNPLFTFPSGCNVNQGSQNLCNFAVSPYDFATIYNVLPLWQGTVGTTIDGTGETIAIVGETDVNPQDWSSFRSLFNLGPGTLNVIHDGPDPGTLGPSSDNEEAEADIDTQWSAAVAKGAAIDLVVSESTETTGGVDLSAEYIVDNALAPVMSESYGNCEAALGVAGNRFYGNLWEQASAEGITAFVSSGDSGSAGCDGAGPVATHGLAVSGISSTPFNVSVGGTDFNDYELNDAISSQNQANYWNLSNDANQNSAKGYIPEMAWNDSCADPELLASNVGLGATSEAVCNSPYVSGAGAQLNSLLNVTAGSGGPSNCVNAGCSQGYAKPSWQSGAGVPSDGVRDTPDVSLFASNGFNGSFYVICQTDAVTGQACSTSDPANTLQGYGGTSVSSPAFAGIMAMIVQKTGSWQGNANYVLYKLAAQPNATCPSQSNPGASCIFYDIPAATSQFPDGNAVPCASGSPNCKVSQAGDAIGILSGYLTTAGYDLATGLGSVNAANLVTGWANFALQPSLTTLTLTGSAAITHGQPETFTLTVAAQNAGVGAPTGDVSLVAATSPNATALGPFPLSAGTAGAGMVTLDLSTSLLPGGSYTIKAHYPGDGTFAASDSASVGPITVSPEVSTTQIALLTFNPLSGQLTSSNATSIYFGQPDSLRVDVFNSSGKPCFNVSAGSLAYPCPTGTIALRDSGNALDGDDPPGSGTYRLNTNGYAEDQTANLSVGQHSIAASYPGDPSYSASTSAADSITVMQASTNTVVLPTAISSSGNQVSVTLQAEMFTQSVTPTAPTGTATFLVNGNSAGTAPVSALNTSPLPPVSRFATSQATFTANLAPGNYTIAGSYSGDTNYKASSSLFPISLSLAADFSMTATNAIVSSPGQSGVSVISVIGNSNFSGTVTVASCAGLPAGAFCGNLPAVVNVTGGLAAPLLVQIQTTAPSAVPLYPRGPSPTPGSRVPVFLLSLVLILALAAASIASVAGNRRRLARLSLAALAFGVLFSVFACGGGSGGGGGGGGGGNLGTPPGTYNVSVNASAGGATHSVPFTLTVQ